MPQISAKDRARAQARAAAFAPTLATFYGLSQGDRVQVDLVSSSWAPYDHKPDKAPRRSLTYVLTQAPVRRDRPDHDGAPGFDLSVQVTPAPGQKGKRGTLLLRPTGEFANTALLIHRDAHGHHTTGWWIWLRPARRLSLAQIVARVAQRRR